jgi:hypothetical protein
MALTTFKLKQVGAQKGYDLLKKKSDALTARLRAILKEIKKAKQDVAKEMQGATFSISEAAWAAGEQAVAQAAQPAEVARGGSGRRTSCSRTSGAILTLRVADRRSPDRSKTTRIYLKNVLLLRTSLLGSPEPACSPAGFMV